MDIFANIFKHENKENVGVIGLNDELEAIYIYSYFMSQENDVLIVTNSLFEASKIFEALLTYTDLVYLFPNDDFLTSEAIAISPDLKMIRLETINKIVKLNKKIVVTHLMGFLRYLPTRETWLNSIITLSKNKDYNIFNLASELYDIGYNREIVINKTGDIAVRGYVLDIFPINEAKPIRIEFFGDTITEIKYFDIETQRSTKDNLDEIRIYPADEFIATIKDTGTEPKQKNLPLVSKKVGSIKDFLIKPTIVYKDYKQLINAYLFLREEIHNYAVERKEQANTDYMHDFYQINVVKNIYLMTLDDVLDKMTVDEKERYDVKEVVDLRGDFDKLNATLKKMLNLNKTIIIALSNDFKMRDFIKYLEVDYIITNEKNIINKKINIIKKAVSKGFEINNLIVITEKELFAFKKEPPKTKTTFKYSTKIHDINKIKTGDYVVHNVHGIGIYMGVAALVIGGYKKDYLLIKYAGKDKLYIPAEKIDLLSKFAGSDSFVPKINKLGGTEWEKTKLRVKGKIQNIARELLLLAAKRENEKGYAFAMDSLEQKEFEEDFMYEETPDQLRSTKEIKKDMENNKAMDRLLCGDVGYGKTEVAFRAMFKAVMDSKQVAYLCPTTILSKQQYENAVERFYKLPINIALLNRFTPFAQTKKIIAELSEGKIDIVFGTHKLLNDKIKFKDLGLLVIDEEQRFGVVQKERIKKYKATVDVLTLSATPIPRTLQMSLLGIRDLSLIETPPINRYPIQTYVLPFSLDIIKQAIYKELSRQGQTFILYNRIDTMLGKVDELSKTIPDAKITYAHGKMPKTELEKRMMAFINKEYDVLVCSTIIETGIDIPNVNTLIIIDADRFGLSQLYQIRGRVGRSDKIAYAYLMYDERKVLNEKAVKRLTAIKEFTELGSGFAIAARDLSIRGAGDILGSEQAGFIDTVGIELYTRMLNEEIARLKGEFIPLIEEIETSKPLINVETHIADTYVLEEELKIEIHKKINEIDSLEKLKEIKAELEDRFGKVDESLEIYMYQEWFEKLAKKLNIMKVNQTKKMIEITFNKDLTRKLDGDKIFMSAYNISNLFKFKYQKECLSVTLPKEKEDKEYIYYLTKLLEEIFLLLKP